MNIIVSACLLGVKCRYDGKAIPNQDIINLKEKYSLIPVCPEILGGLPTPRVPAEKIDGKVKTEDGIDVTEKYIKGAEEAVHLAKLFGYKFAVMKERSPACGSGKVYDGSFSNILTDGYGVTAELFTKNGIKVFGESEIKLLLKELIGE